MHAEPGEGDQHEVVHEERDGLTARGAVHVGHQVINQEGEVQQQQRRHQMDEQLGAYVGFGLPAMLKGELTINQLTINNGCYSLLLPFCLHQYCKCYFWFYIFFFR